MNQQPSTEIWLRPLEREDLRFIHQLNNDANIMRYWFEEPYEAFVELEDLYEKHIHDQTERRFIIVNNKTDVGLVELVEIDHIHRRAEFQIIIEPHYQGHGFATQSTKLAIRYAFSVLNLHKLYLIVDTENKGAIHIYASNGFKEEGILRSEFFINGQYRDVLRMCMFQNDYFKKRKQLQRETKLAITQNQAAKIISDHKA